MKERERTIHRLIAKMPTLAAISYKNNLGHPYMYPSNKLGYVENFLHMMFGLPTEEYKVDPVVASALNTLLVLHADHEQNCSTSTVRLVGSSQSNLYSAVSAGIAALWGPLHGGANQEVIEMLETIRNDGGDIQKWVDKAKDKNDPFRLFGFGHRVYKNFDPRAKIIKKSCDDVLKKMGVNDPVLEIAKQLEEIALKDDYFIAQAHPNVDFYSGIIYRAIGSPHPDVHRDVRLGGCRAGSPMEGNGGEQGADRPPPPPGLYRPTVRNYVPEGSQVSPRVILRRNRTPAP
jgi:citrate synthase